MPWQWARRALCRLGSGGKAPALTLCNPPAQALEARLEAERQAAPAQQAAAAAGSGMSPGSVCLLERRQQRAEEEAERSGLRAGTAGVAGSASEASRASAQPPAISHRPSITPRAAAKGGRTPEELHAEWAARQAKQVREVRSTHAAASSASTVVLTATPIAVPVGPAPRAGAAGGAGGVHLPS